MSSLRWKYAALAGAASLVLGASIAVAGGAQATTFNCLFSNGCGAISGVNASGTPVAVDAKHQNPAEIAIGYPDNAGDSATNVALVAHLQRNFPVATTPSPVTLSASGTNASARWGNHGLVLTVGNETATTFAQMKVNAPGTTAPAQPPAFLTDHYAAGSPRWVIGLANGCYVFGYPAQLGGGATAAFTGTQWEAHGTGCADTHGVYETYAQALADAHARTVVNPAGSPVTSAFIVADGDQPSLTSDTLTAIQYGGTEITRPHTVFTPSPSTTFYTIVFAKNGDWSSRCLTDVSAGKLRFEPCTLGHNAGQRFYAYAGGTGSPVVVPNVSPSGRFAFKNGATGQYLEDPSTSNPSVAQSNAADSVSPGGRQLDVNGTSPTSPFELWTWGS